MSDQSASPVVHTTIGVTTIGLSNEEEEIQPMILVKDSQGKALCSPTQIRAVELLEEPKLLDGEAKKEITNVLTEIVTHNSTQVRSVSTINSNEEEISEHDISPTLLMHNQEDLVREVLNKWITSESHKNETVFQKVVLEVIDSQKFSNLQANDENDITNMSNGADSVKHSDDVIESTIQNMDNQEGGQSHVSQSSLMKSSNDTTVDSMDYLLSCDKQTTVLLPSDLTKGDGQSEHVLSVKSVPEVLSHESVLNIQNTPANNNISRTAFISQMTETEPRMFHKDLAATSFNLNANTAHFDSNPQLTNVEDLRESFHQIEGNKVQQTVTVLSGEKQPSKALKPDNVSEKSAESPQVYDTEHVVLRNKQNKTRVPNTVNTSKQDASDNTINDHVVLRPKARTTIHSGEKTSRIQQTGVSSNNRRSENMLELSRPATATNRLSDLRKSFTIENNPLPPLRRLSTLRPLSASTSDLSRLGIAESGRPASGSFTSSTFSTRVTKLDYPKTRQQDGSPFQVDVLKGIVGIGLKVKVIPGSHVQITEIQKGGPVDKNGHVRVGDCLLFVNSTEMTRQSDARVQQVLRLLPRGLTKLVVSSASPTSGKESTAQLHENKASSVQHSHQVPKENNRTSHSSISHIKQLSASVSDLNDINYGSSLKNIASPKTTIVPANASTLEAQNISELNTTPDIKTYTINQFSHVPKSVYHAEQPEYTHKNSYEISVGEINATKKELKLLGESVTSKTGAAIDQRHDEDKNINASSNNYLATKNIRNVGETHEAVKLTSIETTQSSESIHKNDKALSHTINKKDQVSSQVSLEDQLSSQSVVKKDHVSSQSIHKVNPILSQPIPKTDQVLSQPIPTKNQIPSQSIPKKDQISPQHIPKKDQLSPQPIPKTDQVSSHPIPKNKQVSAQDLFHIDSFSSQYIPQNDHVSSPKASSELSSPQPSSENVKLKTGSSRISNTKEFAANKMKFENLAPPQHTFTSSAQLKHRSYSMTSLNVDENSGDASELILKKPQTKITSGYQRLQSITGTSRPSSLIEKSGTFVSSTAKLFDQKASSSNRASEQIVTNKRTSLISSANSGKSNIVNTSGTSVTDRWKAADKAASSNSFVRSGNAPSSSKPRLTSHTSLVPANHVSSQPIHKNSEMTDHLSNTISSSKHVKSALSPRIQSFESNNIPPSKFQTQHIFTVNDNSPDARKRPYAHELVTSSSLSSLSPTISSPHHGATEEAVETAMKQLDELLMDAPYQRTDPDPHDLVNSVSGMNHSSNVLPLPMKNDRNTNSNSSEKIADSKELLINISTVEERSDFYKTGNTFNESKKERQQTSENEDFHKLLEPFSCISQNDLDKNKLVLQDVQRITSTAEDMLVNKENNITHNETNKVTINEEEIESLISFSELFPSEVKMGKEQKSQLIGSQKNMSCDQVLQNVENVTTKTESSLDIVDQDEKSTFAVELASLVSFENQPPPLPGVPPPSFVRRDVELLDNSYDQMNQNTSTTILNTNGSRTDIMKDIAALSVIDLSTVNPATILEVDKEASENTVADLEGQASKVDPPEPLYLSGDNYQDRDYVRAISPSPVDMLSEDSGMPADEDQEVATDDAISPPGELAENPFGPISVNNIICPSDIEVELSSKNEVIPLLSAMTQETKVTENNTILNVVPLSMDKPFNGIDEDFAENGDLPPPILPSSLPPSITSVNYNFYNTESVSDHISANVQTSSNKLYSPEFDLLGNSVFYIEKHEPNQDDKSVSLTNSEYVNEITLGPTANLHTVNENANLSHNKNKDLMPVIPVCISTSVTVPEKTETATTNLAIAKESGDFVHNNKQDLMSVISAHTSTSENKSEISVRHSTNSDADSASVQLIHGSDLTIYSQGPVLSPPLDDTQATVTSKRKWCLRSNICKSPVLVGECGTPVCPKYTDETVIKALPYIDLINLVDRANAVLDAALAPGSLFLVIVHLHREGDSVPLGVELKHEGGILFKVSGIKKVSPVSEEGGAEVGDWLVAVDSLWCDNITVMRFLSRLAKPKHDSLLVFAREQKTVNATVSSAQERPLANRRQHNPSEQEPSLLSVKPQISSVSIQENRHGITTDHSQTPSILEQVQQVSPAPPLPKLAPPEQVPLITDHFLTSTRPTSQFIEQAQPLQDQQYILQESTLHSDKTQQIEQEIVSSSLKEPLTSVHKGSIKSLKEGESTLVSNENVPPKQLPTNISQVFSEEQIVLSDIKTESLKSVNSSFSTLDLLEAPDKELPAPVGQNQEQLSSASATLRSERLPAGLGPGIYKVVMAKGATGVGFCLEGGVGSPKGDLPITIKRIFKGGPAEKCGLLKVKDEILDVNGLSFAKMGHYEAWNHLKFLEDGEVRITIRRT